MQYKFANFSFFVALNIVCTQQTYPIMNYNLANGYSYPNRSYITSGDGHMPDDLLVAKSDETIIEFEEEELDNYMRDSVIDKRPEPNLFEHEIPHRSDYSAHRLNLMHNGGSGSEKSNIPYNPEAFLGFAPGVNKDPRRIS